MEGRKTGLSRDSYYKSHLVTVTKENAALKQQVEALTRENRDLKKSLFEVSLRYEGALAQLESGQSTDKAEGALTQPQSGAEAIAASAELALRTVANEGLGRFLEGGERTWNDTAQQGQTRDGSSSRQFEWECDLKGHSGAVYTVQFSPCGLYIASGSFDKTVRVWGLENQQEVLCLAEHQLNVTDVAWSGDSKRLISGGFDQTAKEWDMVTGELQASYDADGLVQAISYDPTDENLVYVGTTHMGVAVFDRRAPEGQHSTFKNHAIINTLLVQEFQGGRLLTGDAAGMLKTWDLRTLSCVHQLANDEKNRPISHIHMARPAHGLMREELHGDGRRYLGVNSYDNVLRVYDRWAHASGADDAAGTGGTGDDGPEVASERAIVGSPLRSGVAAANSPPRMSSGDSGEDTSPPRLLSSSADGGMLDVDAIRSPRTVGPGSASSAATAPASGLICAMKGHKNQNWPIRSAFFHGANFSNYKRKKKGGDSSERATTFDDDAEEQAAVAAADTRQRGAHESLLVATGSADNYAYLFDAGESMARSRSGGVAVAPLIQKLHGHTDRVYATHFHPSKAVLATGSADFTIKLWAPRRNPSWPSIPSKFETQS